MRRRRYPVAVTRSGEPRPPPSDGRRPAAAAEPSLSRAGAGACRGGRVPSPPLGPRPGTRAADVDDEPERLLPAAERGSRRPAGLAASRPDPAQLPARARPPRRSPARPSVRLCVGFRTARSIRRLARAAASLPSRAPAESSRGRRRYFNSVKEVWARGYAQATLMRSEDPSLRHHVDELIAADDIFVWPASGLRAGSQWRSSACSTRSVYSAPASPSPPEPNSRPTASPASKIRVRGERN